MGKRGPKATKWEPKSWEEFDKLCAIQCTTEELSAWYDVSIDTIERAIKRVHKKGFAEYYARKRKNGFISIRRVTFQKAQAGDKTALLLFWKQYLGYVDKKIVELEKPSGDGADTGKAVADAVSQVTKLISELAAQSKPTNKEKELVLLATSLGLA